MSIKDDAEDLHHEAQEEEQTAAAVSPRTDDEPQREVEEGGLSPSVEYIPLEIEDHSDGSWIEVRQAETVVYDGPIVEARGWELLTGRTIITFRKRTEADGQAAFVVVPPKSKLKVTEEQLKFDSYAEWRNRVLNEGSIARVDPRLIKHQGEPKSLYRSLRETGGPNGHYNEGVQRWDEKAE